ncbi:DUF2935 domain-containing protein [Clostridium sp. 'White wine YQ']|uniref:DUF2935 domain-containing protein n=1 Tax=Clostridium sp. 'White wine YQ' TaxID=3027474 RepID=UPI0023654B47|nr:DUF2935 domain-containing protein [Clostridium sp. 'White wine YQ']MDD7793524.1 DUF2935 domain-containing protein [Clostridium sp. 'White wine YQ']
MLSRDDFIRQSLELHLFFARIMKEHSFFLQINFTPTSSGYISQADNFRMGFDRLLSEAISLSNGVVSPEVLQSGEVFTPYTLKAEMASSYYTGVNIPLGITEAESRLASGHIMINKSELEQRVYMLNQRIMSLVSALINYKTKLLSDILSCRIFTDNYPLLVDHILREAKFYLNIIQKLQNHQEVNLEREAYEQESFWNRIMAEHSKFIHGLLDPTENELKKVAENFGNEFDQLTLEAKESMTMTIPLAKVTEDSLNATARISKFKAQGTEGILECKIRSIIIPLLADHTLREANHYLRLLKIFNNSVSNSYI